MQYKDKYLFANSQTQKRKTPDQQEFEREFNEVLQYSEYCMNEALKMMHNERGLYPPHYRNKNWTATVMNGFITGMLTEKYPDKMKINQGVLRYVSDKAIIIFKKLSDKYYPSNIQTQKVGRERNQLFALGELSVPIVYVGYVTNDTYDKLNGTYAVCLDDWDEIQWISDLTEISNYEAKVSTEATPREERVQSEKTLVTIKVKEKKYSQ
jgi:hypothetical protein